MAQDILAKMMKVFEEKFGKMETRAFFSPGRVNLIGEHTDYNGGHVFPCAISLGTYALVADRQDDRTRMYSMNQEGAGIIEFGMTGLSYDSAKGWANYPMGVVKVFEEAGHKCPHGFDILIYGTLPNGSGLSSSASLFTTDYICMGYLAGLGCLIDKVLDLFLTDYIIIVCHIVHLPIRMIVS